MRLKKKEGEKKGGERRRGEIGKGGGRAGRGAILDFTAEPGSGVGLIRK